METEELLKSFSLLKRIVSPVNSISLKGDLSAIDRLISNELPAALKDNAPANFPQLYFDFKQEFERFKEFMLFDKLIGKNVVALGGGFSSGKSSFLNSILGEKILPADINPSTSVPAYLVNGKENVSVYGINTFGSRVEMEIEDVKAISHGFGKLDENDSEATLGHILDSIFISSPLQPFENIALLDTPGYSKAENADYSAKTDEKIARAQLNSANYIMWFVQADSGTITQEDISFLESLNKDIPKLIIVNKADKVTEEDLAVIVQKIKDVLNVKGLQYVDVLTYTRKKGRNCDREKILAQLDEWNKCVYESRFAYNFKVLFTRCKEYYDSRIDEEAKRLNRLNKSLTLSENDVITECLTSLIGEIKRSKQRLTEHKETLKKLQDEFFSEIKRIGDIVNIQMPKPSEIDLIRDKKSNPKDVIDQYCDKHGIKRNNDIVQVISDAFADIQPTFIKSEGNSGFSKELAAIMTEALAFNPEQIKFSFSVSSDSVRHK